MVVIEGTGGEGRGTLKKGRGTHFDFAQ
jgi:hypothetical protein